MPCDGYWIIPSVEELTRQAFQGICDAIMDVQNTITSKYATKEESIPILSQGGIVTNPRIINMLDFPDLPEKIIPISSIHISI
jgi:hypothetical protein